MDDVGKTCYISLHSFRPPNGTSGERLAWWLTLVAARVQLPPCVTSPHALSTDDVTAHNRTHICTAPQHAGASHSPVAHPA